MSPEIVSILVLLLMFVVGTVRSVNMGILGFAAAYAVGVLVVGLNVDDVVGYFPGDLFLVLMALTLLFGFAQHNGSIELLTAWILKACRGRVSLAPWVFFVLAALLIALGALFAVAIVAPLAMRFARRYDLDRLMVGMMVVHGALAGAFSPISVYGVFVSSFLERQDLPVAPTLLFVVPLVFNAVWAAVLYVVRGGWRAQGRIDLDEPAQEAAKIDVPGGGTGATGGTATAVAVGTRPTTYQAATLVSLLVLALGVVVLKVDITALALVLSVALAGWRPADAKEALSTVSWGVVVLVTGMVTYITVLQEAGTVEYVSDAIAGLGVPLLSALLLFYVAGVTSALASSVGIIAAAIALAVPFLQSGAIDPVAFVIGLAIASTIVDVSPFSTNGALVLANVEEEQRDAFYRRLLRYAGLVVATGPGLAWLVVVAPGWG